MKAKHLQPIPLSGQDASAQGVQYILAGWQTGTVYKYVPERGERRRCGCRGPYPRQEAEVEHDNAERQEEEPTRRHSIVWITKANYKRLFTDGFLMAAQWHAERAARRPKPAKLVTNAALQTYVQDWLAGVVATSGGAAVRGPVVAWKGRRQGRRKNRQLGQGVEPGADRPAVTARLPGDETMRISHEAIYQALLRARPRGTAARADRLPANRAGAARAAGAQPRTWQIPPRP